MKPQSNPNQPLLSEPGITITRTSITASGQTFELAKLIFVRVEKVRPPVLAALLSRTAPTFRLVISMSADSAPVKIFETQDMDLLERIHHAIDKAAAAYPGASRTRSP